MQIVLGFHDSVMESEGQERERFLEVAWKEQRSWCVQKYVHTYVCESFTWTWKTTEGFKISAAASKIHYPQLLKGTGKERGALCAAFLCCEVLFLYSCPAWGAARLVLLVPHSHAAPCHPSGPRWLGDQVKMQKQRKVLPKVCS